MPGEARSSTKSCAPRTRRTRSPRMSSSWSSRLTLMALGLLLVPVLRVEGVPYGRAHQRSIRLCSKSLSDALYLVCKEHGGYAEPLSYSAEDYARAPPGRGLVDECCYHSCTYEQLEQYCKPGTDDKRTGTEDGIEESLRIVNLPYSSTRELVGERRTGVAAIGSNEKITKSKDRNCTRLLREDKQRRRRRRRKKHERDRGQRGLKGMKIARAERRRGTGARGRQLDTLGEPHDDADHDYDRDEARRACRRLRRRRRRRRRRGKALRETTIASVPTFKVGTTLPEPKDSVLVLFPSGTNHGLRRVSKELADSREFDALERFNSLYGEDFYREDKFDERNRNSTLGPRS